ncbi:MAG: hypothetical protein AAGH65_08540, partial [Pseudomonadota bacterium]
VKYWQRAQQLSQASSQWFPPRIQHLCLVSNGVQTRPYFQPFHASSWLLYRDDVYPDTSSLELSIFLLFQAERQYLQQQIGDSLMANLPYLLILNQQQRSDFCAGCLSSTRPDAAAYRALADAIDLISTLGHDRFKRPARLPNGHHVLTNGLIVHADQQQVLAELEMQWLAAAEAVIQSHRSSTHSPSSQAGSTLMNWLERESPEVVLTGHECTLLWQGPGSADQALTPLLDQLAPEAEQSILHDLQVIDQKSRLFLSTLSNPDDLKPPAAWMTEGGLSFIHGQTNRIAYSLTDDPDRLWQVSPPYERLMLAARTIHEWGHQAAETGWVRVDPDRLDERKQHEQGLVATLDHLADALPPPIKPLLTQTLSRGDKSLSPGQVLLKGLLRRIDDYMANALAVHYLSTAEMDTYVRNNVGSRMLDYPPDLALRHLVRVAYEYQYLALSSIQTPMAWFMNSTWFEALFIQSGVITQSGWVDLTEQIGRICGCYTIDPVAIHLPDRPSG